MDTLKSVCWASLVIRWQRTLPLAGDIGLTPDPEGSHMLQTNEARVPQLLSLCS